MGSSNSKSEPQRIGNMPRVRALLALLEARREWEARNPELTVAWNAAIEEDGARTDAATAAHQRHLAAPRHVLGRLGVPRQALDALAFPRATTALQAAKGWWLSGQAVLLLLGGVGSGKTTAAAWALARQLERTGAQPSGTMWEPAMFVTAQELDGASGYRSDFREWQERLCHCGLLVLDDLGTERLGDGEQGAIQRVVTQRIATGRRTVLTANLDAAAFRERYGERLADRIRESGQVKGSGTASLRGQRPEAPA